MQEGVGAVEVSDLGKAVALGEQSEDAARVGDEARVAQHQGVLRRGMRVARISTGSPWFASSSAAITSVRGRANGMARHVQPCGEFGCRGQQTFDRQAMGADEMLARVFGICETGSKQKETVAAHGVSFNAKRKETGSAIDRGLRVARGSAATCRAGASCLRPGCAACGCACCARSGRSRWLWWPSARPSPRRSRWRPQGRSRRHRGWPWRRRRLPCHGLPRPGPRPCA
jgi:hypothetical protein